MTLEEAIKRYTSNAEYERTNGNLQGCLEFKKLAAWLKDYKRLKEQEPCEDAISKETVIEWLKDKDIIKTKNQEENARRELATLPPVTPQSCGDAISRREAIKKFTYTHKGEHIPDYDCDNFPVQIDVKAVKEILRDLPPVTPQPKTGRHDSDKWSGSCEDAISRILKRMWNCRGKHTTSIDKVKMEQIIRNELSSVTTESKIGQYDPDKWSEPCGDTISRQWLMECVNEGWIKFDTEKDTNRFTHLVRDMAPPVTPQPKIGHWILIDKELSRYKCSECGEIIRLYEINEGFTHDETLEDYPFSHCGAKMQEVEDGNK